MNAALRNHPAYGELRQALAELSLISHAPTQTYQLAPPEDREATPQRWRTNDRRPAVPHLGSHSTHGGDTMTPRGGDAEYKPRAPMGPRIEGDAQSEKAWDEYEMEYAAWRECFERKTPDYFRRRLENCETEGRLVALLDECRNVLQAWRKTPDVDGVAELMPLPGSFLWKCTVADDRRPIEEIVQFYKSPTTGDPLHRSTVYRYRARYRGVRRAYGEAA